jgi:hypothetical protein
MGKKRGAVRYSADRVAGGNRKSRLRPIRTFPECRKPQTAAAGALPRSKQKGASSPSSQEIRPAATTVRRLPAEESTQRGEPGECGHQARKCVQQGCTFTSLPCFLRDEGPQVQTHPRLCAEVDCRANVVAVVVRPNSWKVSGCPAMASWILPHVSESRGLGSGLLRYFCDRVDR